MIFIAGIFVGGWQERRDSWEHHRKSNWNPEHSWGMFLHTNVKNIQTTKQRRDKMNDVLGYFMFLG